MALLSLPSFTVAKETMQSLLQSDCGITFAVFRSCNSKPKTQLHPLCRWMCCIVTMLQEWAIDVEGSSPWTGIHGNGLR